MTWLLPFVLRMASGEMNKGCGKESDITLTLCSVLVLLNFLCAMCCLGCILYTVCNIKAIYCLGYKGYLDNQIHEE